MCKRWCKQSKCINNKYKYIQEITEWRKGKDDKIKK